MTAKSFHTLISLLGERARSRTQASTSRLNTSRAADASSADKPWPPPAKMAGSPGDGHTFVRLASTRQQTSDARRKSTL
jgi:hypothetical protein